MRQSLIAIIRHITGLWIILGDDMKNSTDSAGEAHYCLKDFDQVAIVLQGGGALGSYQAGVLEGLAQAGVEPGHVAGISIGALNAAVFCGNHPSMRVKAMHGFWDRIINSVWTEPEQIIDRNVFSALPKEIRKIHSATRAMQTIMRGQNNFFEPRSPLDFLHMDSPAKTSFYDTSPLRDTLLEFCDFDLINSGKTRVSVGAVNVRTGNFVYFDSSQMVLRPEHFMASGALPPGFPAVEIDGEFYWDGGIVSNTPLSKIMEDDNSGRKLIFQIDLWNAQGELPTDMLSCIERTKDIQYSSRTRAITDLIKERADHKKTIRSLLSLIDRDVIATHPECMKAIKESAKESVNLIHLIYRKKEHQGHYKDFEFSSQSLGDHWREGLCDIRCTLANEQFFLPPENEDGFVCHDAHEFVIKNRGV